MYAGNVERWVRIHSLPGGKRYPTTAAERVELLRRHNAVIMAVLEAAPSVLLGYEFRGVGRLPVDDPLAPWLPAAPPVMRIAPEDDDSEATSVFAGLLSWAPGLLDGPLLAVANDQLRLLLLNWSTGAAYAPYDGGADLFWPSRAERERARTRFANWLSSDPSGL